MISMEEAKRIAEKKENAKAEFIDNHIDGVSYIVVFDSQTVDLVDKKNGDVRSISVVDLLT